MRIKKKRPKGKTVLKKRPNKIEEKKNGTKKQKQRYRESNPVYLQVQVTP